MSTSTGNSFDNTVVWAFATCLFKSTPPFPPVYLNIGRPVANLLEFASLDTIIWLNQGDQIFIELESINLNGSSDTHNTLIHSLFLIQNTPSIATSNFSIQLIKILTKGIMNSYKLVFYRG